MLRSCINQTIRKTLQIHKIQPQLCFATSTILSSSKKQNLPKLPVPELQQTLEKYLRSVMPLLSPDELQKTTCLVEEFGKKDGIGEKLQKLLTQRAEKTENWLEDWWLKTAYLGYRLPVTVHSSPGLIFPLEKFCNVEQRIEYAAKLIITALKYKELIDNDKIPLEKMGKDPLDMGQYKKFFGTCRIPKSNVDEIQFNPNSKHIIIACNNHFFRMCPIDENNKIISFKQIYDELKWILGTSCDSAPAVGILSSDCRDTWANSYRDLMKDKENAKSVEIIQKSLFLVCLDNKMPECNKINRLTLAAYQCIHGGGSKFNGGNRWFDKTVQFVIGEDGITGLTYEHSPSEGQPIAVMTDFLIDNMKNVKNDDCAKADVPCAEKLKFNIDSDIEGHIQQSKKNLDELVCDFDLSCNVFKDFGKNFIKKQKLSPDSFVQMAMQYSFYKLYGKPTAQYESAATRKYIGGRTETIRSCSNESLKFAEAMCNDKIPPMDKRHLLEAAINAHKKYTIDAINGFGIDRHFLGLKLIAMAHNIPLPDIFTDVAFTRSQHFRVTSSQVATKCPGFMAYGAVVPDGYGICYNPRDEEIYFGVSCFNQDKTTNAETMKKCFEESFKDMADVLKKAQKSKL